MLACVVIRLERCDGQRIIGGRGCVNGVLTIVVSPMRGPVVAAMASMQPQWDADWLSPGPAQIISRQEAPFFFFLLH